MRIVLFVVLLGGLLTAALMLGVLWLQRAQGHPVENSEESISKFVLMLLMCAGFLYAGSRSDNRGDHF